MSPTASTTLIIDIDSPALPHWLVDWARSAVNTPTPTFSTITLNATPASGYSLASKLTGWLLTLLDNAIFQRNPFKDFALVSRTFLSTTRRHQLGVAPDSAGNLLRIRLSPEPLCREPLCREPLCPKPLRPQALTEATPACPIHIYIQSPILDAQSFYQARLAGISAFSVIFNAAVAGKAIHTSTAQLSAQGPQSIWASYRLFHRRLERLFSRAVQAALANTGSRALLDAAPLPTPLPLPTQALLIPIRIGKENEPDRLRPRDST
ncbi:MAG: hypothetical protein JNM52_10450 [Betaproteobacteria bacterium]|nr:hypothetical protein [Betaproteobacteria bacterium]